MAKQSAKKDKKSANDNMPQPGTLVDINTLFPLLENFMYAARGPMEDDLEFDPEFDEDDEFPVGNRMGEGIDDDPGFDPQVVEKTGIKFKNVGGIKEIKDELQRVVRFLKEPAGFQKMGAKLPRGILLKGPPGTGKTLLAKAMAQEAGVPFISVSGTEFDASLHGIGPARMRKLMDKAKSIVAAEKAAGDENATCIIYIDEIDVFGASRAGSNESGHQIVMMELARLMDGFDPSDGITVIASTNRPESLDPALVRPGRFDMSLEVAAPDTKGRREILKILARDRKIPLKTDVDFGALAKETYGFVGADLNLLVNEAATLAAEKPGARKVGMAEFKEARERVLKGPRRHLDMSRSEKESTAVHEAGHAIVGLRKEGEGMAPLRNVTILPHVGSLGTTYFGEERETYSHTFRKFVAGLVVDYAGRVAEELAYGAENVSSGASGDIETATETAWSMVARFGFNQGLGKIAYGRNSSGYLGQAFNQNHGLDSGTVKKIYEEMTALTDKAYEEAQRILTEDYDALINLSKALMEYETLDRDEVIAITGIQPQKPKQESLNSLSGKGPKPATASNFKLTGN